MSCLSLEIENDKPFQYPTMGWYKIHSNAMRGSICKFSNVVFKDLPGPVTHCSTNRVVHLFQLHFGASDIVMQHIFSNIVLNNVNVDRMIYIMDPPSNWINPTDCVGFDCTGPENVILSFVDAVTPSGTTAKNFDPVPFDYISSNAGLDGVLTQCKLKKDWNANSCTGDDLALLEFESLDGDRFDRSVQPVFLTHE